MEIMEPLIHIVGCGPGSPGYISALARETANGAEVLVGARHLLELFPHVLAKRIAVSADITGVLDEIEKYLRHLRIVVLVTGDPGLCSLAGPVIGRFGRDVCRVIPGTSSVQVAFARICLDWTDARIIDAHGNIPDMDPHSLAAEEKIAVLPGHSKSRQWVADLLQTIRNTHRTYFCEDLTMENERITIIEPGEAHPLGFSPRTILLCIKEGVL